MRVITKRYQLETKKYIKMAMISLIKSEWKYFGIPLALLILGIVFPDGFWWFFTFMLLVPGVYLLFWWIQFFGLTQHEAGKMFFEKMSYELDGKQFLLKIDAKHGMPIDWKQIKKASKVKDGYVLTLSKAQFIFLPFEIFKTESDQKLAEAIFKRKNLI